jgi:hypothetical protein
MTSFYLTLLRFLKEFKRSLGDPEFRAIFVALVTLLISGAIIYSAEEGWTVIDSLYFCVMTLSTVGQGELHPTTNLSKLFTILYVVVGEGAGTVGTWRRRCPATIERSCGARSALQDVLTRLADMQIQSHCANYERPLQVSA